MKILQEKEVEKIEAPEDTWAVLIIANGTEHMVYFVDFCGKIFDHVRVEDARRVDVVKAINHMVKFSVSPRKMFHIDCLFTTNRIFEPDRRAFNNPQAWEPGFEFLQIIRHLSFCKNVLNYRDSDEYQQTKACVDYFINAYRVPIELKDEALHEREVQTRAEYIKQLETCIW